MPLASKQAVIILLACTVLYWANWKPLSQVDTTAAPYAAWSLVSRGNLELQDYPYLDDLVGGAIFEIADGRRISKYPPGSTLFAVPFVLPFVLPYHPHSKCGKVKQHRPQV